MYMYFRRQSPRKYIQHECDTIPCTVKTMRQLSCTDRPYKANRRIKNVYTNSTYCALAVQHKVPYTRRCSYVAVPLNAHTSIVRVPTICTEISAALKVHLPLLTHQELQLQQPGKDYSKTVHVRVHLNVLLTSWSSAWFSSCKNPSHMH